MFINISGLPPFTSHGFHIHELGDISTKGEFTPLMLNTISFSTSKLGSLRNDDDDVEDNA